MIIFIVILIWVKNFIPHSTRIRNWNHSAIFCIVSFVLKYAGVSLNCLEDLKITLDNDQPYGVNVAKVMAEVIDRLLYNGKHDLCGQVCGRGGRKSFNNPLLTLKPT